MMELTGKVALVTGAASGIGEATAHALARAGAKLIVVDVAAEKLAVAAAALGPALLAAEVVDVADRAAMAALATRVHARVPALDVLVNNAGVAFAGGLLDTPPAQWDWVLGINLGGVVNGCHAFAPAMVERGAGGAIVNVASVLGMYAAPGMTAYVASKFAVLGLSQALRVELAPHRIAVSAICPGMIATQIVASARAPTGAPMQRAIDAFRKKGASPAKVGDAIVDAIRRDRAVVPVTPEAWAIWGLSRAAPGVLSALGARALRRLT